MEPLIHYRPQNDDFLCAVAEWEMENHCKAIEGVYDPGQKYSDDELEQINKRINKHPGPKASTDVRKVTCAKCKFIIGQIVAD